MEEELLISAKPSRRIFAFLFDAFLYLLVSSLLVIPCVLAFIEAYQNPGDHFKLVALFISSLIAGALVICLYIFYFVCLPVIREGQTLGKKLFKIRIISVDTNEGPNAKTMFLREAFRIIIFVMTFGLSGIASFISLLVSDKHTTFHEQLSSTRVVNVNFFSKEKVSKIDVN